MERAGSPSYSFDDLGRRRDRKRRNQRIAASVVGIVVFVAAVWIVTSAGSFYRTQMPAAPSQTNVSVTPPGEFAPDVPLTTYTSPQYGYSIAGERSERLRYFEGSWFGGRGSGRR